MGPPGPIALGASTSGDNSGVFVFGKGSEGDKETGRIKKNKGVEEVMVLASDSDSEEYESEDEDVREVRFYLDYFKDALFGDGFSRTLAQLKRINDEFMAAWAVIERRLGMQRKRGYDQAMSINRQQLEDVEELLDSERKRREELEKKLDFELEARKRLEKGIERVERERESGKGKGKWDGGSD